MADYTKGKWEPTEGLNGIWYVNADNKTIVQAWDFPEAEANARLIAAAPLMYEALDKIRGLTSNSLLYSIADKALNLAEGEG